MELAKATRTETGVPAGFPLSAMPADPTATTVYGIVFAVGVAIFGVIKLANRFSRDKVSYTGDRAAEDVIEMLKKQLEQAYAERDKAMRHASEAWDTRTANAQLIGELTASNDHLKRRIGELEKDVEKLTGMVHKLRNQLAPAELKKEIEQAK